MASTCDYYSMSLSRTGIPRTRASSTSSEVLQCEVKNYFASLNKLTSKILLERENIATSHSHLPQQQKEEVIKEHFIPTTVRELYPRLSKRWPGHKVGDERSLPHTCQSVQDEDSVNSVCSTVITGFQREVEVDIPPIDPSIPYKEPPCPLDRRAPVRMSFRVSKKPSVGKESKYEFLRRKLSLRPQKASQVVGDIGSRRDGSLMKTSLQQRAVYPETGERTLPQSSASRRGVKAHLSPPVVSTTNKAFTDHHQYPASGGTLSQPAYPSYDYTSQKLRRDPSSRQRQSPLANGLASSPPQTSYYSQLQLPQPTTVTRANSTRWQRAASASIPASNNLTPYPLGYGSGQSSVRGYSRVMSNCNPMQVQRDFHTRSQVPANLVRAPHVLREEAAQDHQRRSFLPPISDSHNRGRHVSTVSSDQTDFSKSRRRHRSQSPANILNRSHNEYRYEQPKVRSLSTDRYLDEIQEDRQQKKRSNSVDFDLISPVDNTCRYPISPRPRRNAHELQLASQRRGGSTYTTATSSYARMPRKKQTNLNSNLSQSAEALGKLEQESRQSSATIDEECLYSHYPRIHRQAREGSLTSSMLEGSHLRQARISADSGYTSPTDHDVTPRGLREKYTQKQTHPFYKTTHKDATSVRVIGPKETMETSW